MNTEPRPEVIRCLAWHAERRYRMYSEEEPAVFPVAGMPVAVCGPGELRWVAEDGREEYRLFGPGEAMPELETVKAPRGVEVRWDAGRRCFETIHTRVSEGFA